MQDLYTFLDSNHVQFSSCTENYQTCDKLHDYIKQPALQAVVNLKKAIKQLVAT